MARWLKTRPSRAPNDVDTASVALALAITLALTLVCASGCRYVAGYAAASSPDAAAVEVGPGTDGTAEVGGDDGRPPPSFSCAHYPPGYDYALPLAIDASRVVGSHVDFPLLVVLEDPALGFARSGGADVRFISAAGVPLAHEVELFRGQPAPRLIAWVSLPTLADDGAGGQLCAYFGNADAKPLPDTTAASVWRDYAAVFHFAATPLSDASPSAIAVTGPAKTRSSGLIGAALQLDAAKGEGLVLADGPAENDGPFSVAVWVKPRQLATDTWVGLVTKGRESDREWYGLWARPAGDGHQLSFGWTGFRPCCPWGEGNIDTSERLEPSRWRYLVGTFDGQLQRFYVDGKLVGERQNSYVSIAENMVVGVNNPPTEKPAYFDGLLDELRLSKVARSAEWIATQYQNQVDPKGFIQVGALQCEGECP